MRRRFGYRRLHVLLAREGILAIVDDFTRECLAIIADTSLSGLRVARELDALIAIRGRPAMIVSDNGTEPSPVRPRRHPARHSWPSKCTAWLPRPRTCAPTLPPWRPRRDHANRNECRVGGAWAIQNLNWYHLRSRHLTHASRIDTRRQPSWRLLPFPDSHTLPSRS